MSHGKSPLTKIVIMGRIIEELYPSNTGLSCAELANRLNNGSCPSLPTLKKHGVKINYIKSLLTELKRKRITRLVHEQGYSRPRLWKVDKGSSSSLDIWRK